MAQVQRSPAQWLVVALGLWVFVADVWGGESMEPGQRVAPRSNSAIVWAMNVGGEAHRGIDGTRYEADNLQSGRVGTVGPIKGSQDPVLFQSYREGDIAIRQPLPDGNYDITFKFVEPFDRPAGSRIFDTYAEGQRVITALDVRSARDGNPRSDLVRTVTDVRVQDGFLDVSFRAAVGEPVLSAIVVRRRSPASDSWTLVWNDEFDYAGPPDPERWTHNVWKARRVNDEDQTYTDRLKNVEVRDGRLFITALKEQYNAAEYTSGRIHSRGKGDLLYGRIDVRARLPAGQGTWPAIWMMPSQPFTYATTCDEDTGEVTDVPCDAWPNSGEIDIMEHVGYDMQTVHGTVHTRAYYWRNGEQRKASVVGKAVDSEFHVYSVEWSPEHIEVFYDDAPYFYYRNENTGWESWPFDKPFHVILNLAIGGGWGRAGGPIDDSIFPAVLEVDYVRMFKATGAVTPPRL